MLTECEAESLKWSIFSASTVSTFVSSETYLNPVEALRIANDVCHCKDRLTAEGGGTSILARLGIVHHSVPVSSLTHLEVTRQIHTLNVG